MDRVQELLRRASAHRDSAPVPPAASATTAPRTTVCEPLAIPSTVQLPSESGPESIFRDEGCASGHLRERQGSDESISPRSVQQGWFTNHNRPHEREAGILKQTMSFHTFVGIEDLASEEDDTSDDEDSSDDEEEEPTVLDVPVAPILTRPSCPLGGDCLNACASPPTAPASRPLSRKERSYPSLGELAALGELGEGFVPVRRSADAAALPPPFTPPLKDTRCASSVVAAPPARVCPTRRSHERRSRRSPLTITR